jgi:uncharacterized phiE125 gp8 family phage protein
MALKLITAPTVEPVTVEEAKTFLRVDGNDEDLLITGLIASVRAEAEKITRRALLTQTWELVLDSFPSYEIVVPLPRLQSVTSIKYIDLNGVEQTLDPATYQVDTDNEPARIVPAYGQSWPAGRNQINAVRVRYVAGYGATADLIPENIKLWIKTNITLYFDHRDEDLKTVCDGLLGEFMVVGF